ncbi:ROK family transcriptional regulator [Glycomyces algeriensis]|uniref:Sugar kinase n=1 Tax=Glycomyces algeriensis TaxID=256037 RepID=A0A9W6GB32_9ACTN|nr:ROK family transcriptional regulator [Glycomyces algeriensis]MDA1368854.1 ROK family transcriptional regulator [Glycomyces algeriensis]MDR7350870.1 putative NBD/HSP70 family sugar kinase [Glycomyces algeriensis]GLI43582.1 sugar kinase [Glycomyces algeriensis]
MKSTSRDIRLRNCFAVLRHLIADAPTSRQILARETDLSVATVSNLVTDLIELGVVVEVGREDSGGGRPRALLAPNAGGGVMIGVDVAETYVYLEVYDLTLAVVDRVEERMEPSENAPEQVIGHIVSAMDQIRERLGDRAILGLGVSLPGQVDVTWGVSGFAPNWNWHDVPFRKLLDDRLQLGVPIYLDNPLKTITVGELWFGDGRGVDRLAVLILGTGVGAGLAFGGQLYRGATNSAGEWGHTTINPAGPQCRCGAKGCIEAYVGAPAILWHWGQLDPRAALGSQTEAMAALAAAWEAGETTAVRTVETVAEYLAAGVANLLNLFNPDLVVFDGWVTSVLGDALVPEFQRRLADHAMEAPLKAARLKRNGQDRNMVALGAAALALEGHLNRLNTVGSRSRR